MQSKKTDEDNGSHVLPGDIIAKAEEYLPGFNARESDGKIVSLAAGVVRRNERRLTISVYPERSRPKIMRDDVVYGQVIKADKGRYSVRIGAKVSRTDGNLVYIKEDANLRIQGSRNNTMAPVHVTDYVRAKVMGTGRNIDVSIGGKHLGVLKALCQTCRTPLELKGRTLYCENCEHTESRKISEDYGLIYLDGEKRED